MTSVIPERMEGIWQRQSCPIESRGTEQIAITGHGHIDGIMRMLDIAGYHRSSVMLDRVPAM